LEKINTFDDTTRRHIQTGNDSFGQCHGASGIA
ncbi:MAG: hypothetical protein ACI802_002909, partial [Candidatus Paceibacteria bacterium]